MDAQIETLFSSVFGKRLDQSRVEQITRKFGDERLLDRLNYLLINPPFYHINDPYKFLYRSCETGVRKNPNRKWR